MIAIGWQEMGNLRLIDASRDQRFRREFNVTSTDSKRNSWYKWSHSLVDAAEFTNEFVDVADFEEFVRRFDYNVSTRMALRFSFQQRSAE